MHPTILFVTDSRCVSSNCLTNCSVSVSSDLTDTESESSKTGLFQPAILIAYFTTRHIQSEYGSCQNILQPS
jgi:hypothetical protein